MRAAKKTLKSFGHIIIFKSYVEVYRIFYQGDKIFTPKTLQSYKI